MENDSVKFKNEFKRLRLKSKTVVYIDWANVYGWTKSRKREVDRRKCDFDYGSLIIYGGSISINLKNLMNT